MGGGRPVLNGRRVLDLTDRRGEVAAYVLADLGAEVTKLVPADLDPVDESGDDLAFRLGDERVAGREHRLELPGRMPELVPPGRNEAQVVRPRIAVQVDDPASLLLENGHVE